MSQSACADLKLALFDLDHTLLPLDSDHAFSEFCIRKGWRSEAAARARNAEFFGQYQRGVLDIYEYTAWASEVLVGRPMHELLHGHAQFMQEVILPALQPQAFSLIQRYRDAGWTLILITATNEYVAKPIGRALGFEHVMTMELKRDANGNYVNRVRGVPSLQQGKVLRLKQWLAARRWTEQDVADSVMYSDSINDLPLLEWAHQAVATNPDASLARIATERGWPILKLFADD